MENIKQGTQTNIPRWHFDPALNEHVILGNDLPEDLKVFFFGFDFEVQLSNLPSRVVDYIGASIDQINMLLVPYIKIENGETTTENKEWFDYEIKKINTEVKEIIRAHRGVDGFTMKELGTIRELGKQHVYQTMEKTGGLFGRKRSFEDGIV
jgi:hypothetical protein